MADKTPGQVAYEAHALALVKETGIGTNAFWDSLPEHEVKVWEATAGEVRHQLGCQNRVDELVSAHLIRDVGMIRDIRAILREWHAQTPKPMSEWVFHSAQDVVETIEDLLAPSPMPEAEAECVEDAGEEPRKSPPPAER